MKSGGSDMKYVLAALMLPGGALACDFCSTSTVLSQERGACFTEIFEDRMARLEQSNRGFVQVDLDSCLDQAGNDDTRSSVGTSLNDRSAAYAQGGKLFLTGNQMSCLQSIILQLDGQLDPEKLVEIPSECPNN